MKSVRFIVIFLTLTLFLVIIPACKEELPVEEITEKTQETTESEAENNVPEISNLKILPDNPITSQDLTLSYEFNDPDNDPDKSIIKWYENDTYINDLDNALVIPKIYLDPEDIWYAVISPYDGRNYGEDLTSEEVIISIGDMNPTIIGNMDWTNDTSPYHYPNSFIIGDNYIYISYGVYNEIGDIKNSVIQITDISDKSNPRIISSLDLGPIIVEKTFIKDNHAYIEYCILDYENWKYVEIGIKIFDLSSKENPELIDTVKFDEEIYGFYVGDQNNDIYVLDNKYNLNILSQNEDGKFNINNKIKLPIKKTSRVLYITGNYAVIPYQVDHYYSIYDAGVQIVDITEGTNARVASELILPGQFEVYDLFLDNKYLMLAEGKSIHIFDISDKSNPKDINKIDIPSYFYHIEDDVLYTSKEDSAYDQLYARGEFTRDDFDNIVPNNDSYIQIIDLKDKKNPELLYTVDTKDIASPSEFFKENNYLYCYYTNPRNYGTGADGILIIKLY
jgi:hypothetical protein